MHRALPTSESKWLENMGEKLDSERKRFKARVWLNLCLAFLPLRVTVQPPQQVRALWEVTVKNDK